MYSGIAVDINLEKNYENLAFLVSHWQDFASYTLVICDRVICLICSRLRPEFGVGQGTEIPVEDWSEDCSVLSDRKGMIVYNST